jgi:1-acyl-sn-glycerol-3-phosphate acyltransferase
MSAPVVTPGESVAIDPARPTTIYTFCRSAAKMAACFLFDLKIYNLHHVPRTGGVLTVANHQSYLDPALIGCVMRRPMSFLAKSELFEHRQFGWLIRQLRAFPVKRGAGDVGAVKETIKRLQEGHLLNLFPEGSRTRTGELGPIQSGVALIIRRARVPVVPVAIDGTFDAWPKNSRLPRPCPVRLNFGPPMELHELSAEEITQTIGERLAQLLREARERAAG